MTDLTAQKKFTVQDATRQGVEHSIGLLFWLANAGQIIDPWWSKNRDAQLRNFWKDSDHFSGAIYMMSSKLASVPRRVEPRDATVKLHIKAADVFQSLLDESPQFGQGWTDFWTRFYEDLWCSDNGAFGEVIGDGEADGPIKGPPVGLAHLDSYNCQRTSDPEFPVIFTDTAGDGKRYKFHHSRVIFASQLPSAAADMYGVGFCWLSRAINVVQNLKDISVYKQEKLGSRPLRGILTGAGINTESLIGALAMAEEGMDNQGLSRYAKTAVIGSTNPQFTLDLLNLASMPDGFDEKSSTELAMFVIALTGGFPPRWLWPATQTGATKADAMYSHIAGSGGGANWHLDMMTRLLGGSPRGQAAMGGKFLPPYLKLVFDYQDDEQDRLQADIKKARADRRKTDLEDSVVTVRVAREQALSDGDLTRAQFEQLELDDGNLPDGESVLTLFSSLDPFFIEHLDLGTDDPLAIETNDPLEMLVEINEAALNVQDVLANSVSGKERRLAQQASSALGQLKEIYEQISVQNIVTEQQAVEGQAAQPGTEGQETEEEIEEKGFNFGAKVGETIAGQLARGEGGRFANAAEVASARNELLANLLARLRAKRGGGDRGGAVAARKAANRAKIGEVDGVGGGTVDALSAMRTGDPVEPGTLDTLQKRGLAQVNADGSITMSTAGRKLLTAANTGDVDKAKKALADAAKGKGGKKRGGKGGKKPKPTPEQRAAEKRQQEAQARNQTFTEIADRLGVDAADMTQLFSFSEGGEADPESAQRLEDAGFVERDSEGNLRMTSDGRAVLSAGTKGDKRRALDVASRARDKKARQQEREQRRQERQQAQVTRKREQAAEIQGQIDELTEQLEQQAGVGRSEQEREVLRARIEQLQSRMEELEQEADELEAKEIGPFEFKSQADFALAIRAAIRGLWSGQFERFDFVDSMRAAIERRLREAWLKGAAECGIKENELSPAEISALTNLVNSQLPPLVGFSADIAERSKANGGKLGPLLSRGNSWINRYPQAVSQGKAMACQDKKLEWRLGEAEHCSSCLKLAGKVKRASFWAESGIIPRVAGADYLECRGYNCQCDLVPVTFNASSGPLPRLP